MGNTQSPPVDPLFASASRAFTQKEIGDLRALFVSMAAQSQSDGRYISPSVFQAYFGLKGALGERLFDLVTQQRKDRKLTFEDLVIAKGTYEKGTNDEIEEFVYQLSDITGDGALGSYDSNHLIYIAFGVVVSFKVTAIFAVNSNMSAIESVLVMIFDDIFNVKSSEPGSSSRGDMVDIFLNAATFSRGDERCNDKSMSFEDFRKWCTLIPSLRKFLGSLLIPPDSGRPGSQVPKLLHLENIDSSILLLRKEYAWHIGGALSQQELVEWKLLYHSTLNGLSFNTFLGSITNDNGPTVLIIKDNEGYIYGGYASQPWERHSDFYGDMKSFLFQLHPKASIFRPTGANNNLQWCAVSFSSEAIPNGIGFGGRVNHFGLFLSAGFDQGHTFSCTTFNSPCLSKNSKICPEVIECWGVVRKGKQEERQDALKGTVLERFKEDRNMLNMVGIANASE
ncbi:hypothetical protein SLE2022_080030 [Rubroshorea leprosula]